MPTCENPADSPSKARKFQSQDSVRTNALWEIRYLEATYNANEAQQMPQLINLHEAILRRSPCLKENSAASSIKHKAHVNFGKILLKAVYLFTLIFNFKDSIPSRHAYPLRTNSSFTAREVHRCHELNAFYDGTFNQLHHLNLAKYSSINEVLIYQKATKEADAELFVSAIQKKSSDQESRDHWTIVKR